MKKILTDVDGVLLDWDTTYHKWMRAAGYDQVQTGIYAIHDMYDMTKVRAYDLVREFNESSWISELPAFRDSQTALAELSQLGYTFEAITAFGTEPRAVEMRKLNLRNAFPTVKWDNIICTPMTSDKSDELAAHSGTGRFWVDDKPSNCDQGVRFGLNTIIMNHPHNQWYDNPQVKRVDSWAEIVKYIAENQ